MSKKEKITKKCKVSSREIMVYSVMLLWLIFAIFCLIYQPHDASGKPLEKIKFTSMAVYFLSLTGFIGSYIYGVTVKPKENTSTIFVKGDSDKREIVVYVCMLLWALLGVYGILTNMVLDEIGAYFGALTPFVGAYILGETSRHSGAVQETVAQTEGVTVQK